MKINKINFNKKGNIGVSVIIILLFISVVFLTAIDIQSVYIAREIAKNASDAASLAISQKLIFFENDNYNELADYIINKNNCELHELIIDYSEVTVTVKKKMKYVFFGKFINKNGFIYSSSKAKITYPWDATFENCKSLLFDF